MSTNYPNDIDNFGPDRTDNTGTKIPGSDVNNLRHAMVAVQTELGTNPKGTKANVATRLNDIETSLSAKADQVTVSNLQEQLYRNFHDDYMLWLELYYNPSGLISNASLEGAKGMHIVPFDGTDRDSNVELVTIKKGTDFVVSGGVLDTSDRTYPFGTEALLNSVDDYAEVTGVYGDRIVVYLMKGQSSGIAEIIIDGVSKGTIDLYSSSNDYFLLYGQPYSYSVSLGAHTVRVRCTGTKNAASSNIYVTVSGVVGYYSNESLISTTTLEKNFTLYPGVGDGSVINQFAIAWSSHGSSYSGLFDGTNAALLYDNNDVTSFSLYDTWGGQEGNVYLYFYFPQTMYADSVYLSLFFNGNYKNVYCALEAVEVTNDFVNWATAYTGTLWNIFNNAPDDSVWSGTFSFTAVSFKAIRLKFRAKLHETSEYAHWIYLREARIISAGTQAKKYTSALDTLDVDITYAKIYLSAKDISKLGFQVSNDNGANWVTPTQISTKTDPKFTSYTEYELDVTFPTADNRLLYRFNTVATTVDNSVKRLGILFK